MKRSIALVAVTASLALCFVTPAQADLTGDCGEFGYWSPGTLAGGYTSAYRAETDVTTGTPPTATCVDSHGVTNTNNLATRHSSLHMTINGQYCFEVVAYRESNGNLFVYSYNCGGGWPGTQQGPTSVFVNANQLTSLHLYATYDGPGRWSGWYARPDTGQWVYVSSLSGIVDYLRPHAESTGYNYYSVRTNTFTNFTATTNGATNAAVTVACSATDPDNRQALANKSAGYVNYTTEVAWLNYACQN